ncbi:MAG: PIN domain nuclease [Chlorobi bacterium]|nr:PIN domain nuclease [Chlorobiota bacterium]MCI0716639.1 PIN domain nuclease [Chlorobiota bacterium]
MGRKSEGDEEIISDGFLADTSVWVNFFRDKSNRETEILTNALYTNEPFFICPVILMEILQGVKKDSDYFTLKEMMLSMEMLEIEHIESAIGAAELYRNLRKKGFTIKKSNDCLIAYYSLYFNIPLLHNDSDFDLIAKHTALKIM